MKQKLNELQVYSGIAILFVVLIHVNWTYLHSLDLFKYADIRWMFYYINIPSTPHNTLPYFYNLIDKITHVAVPMFIFIAGYKYAYNQKISYKEYFFKKIRQVFKPFLIISILYILLNLVSLIRHGNSLISSIIISLKLLFKIFLGINIVTPLWYIPMYLLITLSYPLIVKLIKNNNFRLTIFIILGLVWVMLDMFIPFIKTNQLPYCFIYYFSFYELGVIFHHKNFKNKKSDYLIILYLVLVCLSAFIPSRMLNIILTEIIITPLAVIAFYYISLRIKENKFFSFLGKYSFFIFLFHEPTIEKKLSNLFFVNLGFNHFYPSMFFIALLTIFASIVIYKLLEITHIKNWIF